MYQTIKTFHIIVVSLSVLLFIFRFLMYSARSEVKKTPHWLKLLPHINDTLLLSSGVALISITKFVPFTPAAPWLTYKLIAVVCYIICGYFALSEKKTVTIRIIYFLASLTFIAFVVTLATLKHIPIYSLT